jgi:hypothetical protein
LKKEKIKRKTDAKSKIYLYLPRETSGARGWAERPAWQVVEGMWVGRPKPEIIKHSQW